MALCLSLFRFQRDEQAQHTHHQAIYNQAMHNPTIHPKIIIAKEPHHYEPLDHSQCIPWQMLGT